MSERSSPVSVTVLPSPGLTWPTVLPTLFVSCSVLSASWLVPRPLSIEGVDGIGVPPVVGGVTLSVGLWPPPPPSKPPPVVPVSPPPPPPTLVDGLADGVESTTTYLGDDVVSQLNPDLGNLVTQVGQGLTDLVRALDGTPPGPRR